MPSLARSYFRIAVIFLVLGIAAGLQMAISQNHNVIGAHAHANLLGWVTMALFGVYYSLNPAKAETRLARIQFWVYTAGVVVMTPSLYMLYLGYPAFEPLVAIGSLGVFAGVLMFAAIVWSPAVSASAPLQQASA